MDLELEVKYLKRVVNNLLINKPMGTKKNEGKNPDPNQTPGVTDPAGVQGDQLPAPPVDGDTPSTKMRYRAIDIKYQGRMIRVTQETLDNDPELLAHMQAKLPEEFV